MVLKRSPISAASAPKTAIVGGGVIGLGIGWRLAQSGCDVTVFERGEAARGASWAAAGMLAAGLEAEPGETSLLALNRESQRRWPGFAAELEAATGLSVDLRQEGTLGVALTNDDLDQLKFTYEFQRNQGIELRWLSAGKARQKEPRLAPSMAGAVFSPDDHQVDNRKLALALKAAFLGAGGVLLEQSSVSSVESAQGKMRGVCLADGTFHEADVVVLAAGAWSRQIGGLPSLPPIRPIKGQMLSLAMEARAPLIDHVIWAPGCYLVPRLDGTLIVGATVEERGFDETLTAGGVLSLLEAAWRVLPAIDELPLLGMWTGFRPGSPDDAPILGPGGIDGLILATGHHRNGILLTPVTADEIARLVRTGEPGEILKPFGAERFAAKKEAIQ